MVMIYCTSKDMAVNSQQIVSTEIVTDGTFCTIDAIMATEQPNIYQIYQKDFSATFTEQMKEEVKTEINDIQSKITDLETKLSKGTEKESSTIIIEIADLDKELKFLHWKLDGDRKDIYRPDFKEEFMENETKKIFRKFLQVISDPKYLNSLEPLDLEQIL